MRAGARKAARLSAYSALVPLAGCVGSPSFLLPAGPVADKYRYLFFFVIILLLIVVLPVFIGLPWVLWRYRHGNDKAEYRPKWSFSKPLEYLIWGVPVLVVAALSVQLWIQTHALDPYKRLPGSGGAVEIQAVGLDWKWLFIYPDRHIATLNKLVIPAGRPVHFTLTTDTVMQSLMIPRLGGQIYAMAGMATQLNLQADRTGEFFGENTQYNGKGFHKQNFTTYSVSDKNFARWIERVRSEGKPLDQRTYDRLAEESTPTAPIAFSSVEPGLFGRIIAKHNASLPARSDRQSWKQP